MRSSSQSPFIAETRAWVEHAVIGLNLCPFAPAPALKGLIRYVVTDASTLDALVTDLLEELAQLAEASPSEVETTLLIHPHVLENFIDFNNFLDIADQALSASGLEGEIQIASFHPQYQFADTAPDDIGNATNRSPYPTLHLLRESSIARAVDSFGDTDRISDANIATLERLGSEGWAALRQRCRDDLGTT
ncbi:MAG: DUF1415 domain-containing protein [Steroidobacteraceae bacterium]